MTRKTDPPVILAEEVENNMMWYEILAIASVGLLLLAALVLLLLPSFVQGRLNRTLRRPPFALNPEVERLHEDLLVADLHADALLWRRDLNRRHRIGHVDVPRLIEGNVAIQAFTIVTQAPRGLNIERNDATSSDMITLLAVLQRWPPRTWGSLTERAVYQAEKLRRFAARSAGKLTLLETGADLRTYLVRRAETHRITAGFLGIEGAHALEGDLNNLDRLFDIGVRLVGLTHFFDNEVGGSAHGMEKGGLTDFGHRVVERSQELGMVIDLAHASEALMDDVLAESTQPVLVSHTGVRGTHDNQRNLADRHIRGAADTGGIVGIGFWHRAVGGSDAKAIVRALRYSVDLVGSDHVGLGSDFDGAVTTPFDASGMALLTEALVDDAFSTDEIRKIMGGNVIRVLDQVLPD